MSKLIKSRHQYTVRVSVCTLRVIAIAIVAGLFTSTATTIAAPFTEEAIARGINYVVTQGGSDGSFGCGVAAVDLDGDLDADLIVTGSLSGLVGVYENMGDGTFQDRSATSGIPILLRASGVVCGDYDNDGDLDVYFSNWLVPNTLMRNDGGFTFTDVSQAAGVDDSGAGVGCAWADIDLDGNLDLYLANRTGTNGSTIPNRMYRNLGDGTFEDIAASLNLDDDQLSFQAFFFDMDRDGDSDLFVSSDLGDTTRLFENLGGGFRDLTTTSGAGVNIKGMGVTAGDINIDGLFDVYETNTATGNPLFINQGGGLFVDQASAWGVTSNRIGWGALLFDYDNDRFLDIYVCNQASVAGPTGLNRLLVHAGSPPCVDVAPAMNAAIPNESYCLAAADFDDDGDIDLIVQSKDDQIRLLMNQQGQTLNWIKVKVFGEASNRYAIGAMVEASVAGNTYIREVRAGENFKSQNEHTIHFGLGAATQVDDLTITWPGGEQLVLSQNLANQTVFAVPNSRLGDLDRDGVVAVDDIPLFVNAVLTDESNPALRAFADINRDLQLDGRDVVQFADRLLGG